MNLCVCSERRNRAGFAFAARARARRFQACCLRAAAGSSASMRRAPVFVRYAAVDDQFRFVCALRHPRVHALFWRDAEPNVVGQVGEIVPFDSTCTRRPSRRSASISAGASACASGSPPVSTTIGHSPAGLTHHRDHVVHAGEESRGVVGIAERASKIAPREAHENCGRSRPRTLALNAVEHFA